MDTHAQLRALPSVDRLARGVARAELAARRAELLDGEGASAGSADLVARAQRRLRTSLRGVLNATGVVVHTNLGRAPLPQSAIDAVNRVALGYSNLELDLESGQRGSRHDHVASLLCELTGAEAAMAVNNCAAATLLGAAALAGDGRALIVSRGELVEIGGGFRIPEVVAQAGSTLVEVGTTNRTRLSDYARAIAARGHEPSAVLRVHQSNFRTVGFVAAPSIEELCGLGVPVLDDVGSGHLYDEFPALADEPSVAGSIRAGATLVMFSGDKLLGGPQAGVLVGTDAAIKACREHPLARATRIDKLSLAALEATLALYRDPAMAVEQIPVLAMLQMPETVLARRAGRLAALTDGRVIQSAARVGGGALPLLELTGPVVEIDAGRMGVVALAASLRRSDPPVIGRIQGDRLLLDPRTLTDDETELAGRLVASTMSAA